MPKQSSPALSSLAARVMAGYEPSRAEIVSLAASVLSQDETPGQVVADPGRAGEAMARAIHGDDANLVQRTKPQAETGPTGDDVDILQRTEAGE